MEDAGFRLGQLLAAVDAVHIGYCADVRGNQVPPTLVGNSVFAAAGRDPNRALSVLQTRWKPYHAWAKRHAERGGSKPPSQDDARGWAVWQFTLASRLCDELAPVLRARTERADDAFRAELLLGYVAGIRPDKTLDTSGQDAKESAQ